MLYDLFDLGVLAGKSHVGSSALALNTHNQVVGVSYGWLDSEAFYWEAGEMIGLGTLGGNSSIATAINDHGQVVGYSRNSQGEYRAFSWTKAGGMVDLGFDQSALPRGISPGGAVVGDIATGFSPTNVEILNAFYWNGGEPQVLSSGGNLSSSAVAINVNDRVTGWFGPPNQLPTMGKQRGFVWDPNTNTYTLSNELNVWANARNNKGLVVGQLGYQACRWITGSPVLQLTGLVPGQYSFASGVND